MAIIPCKECGGNVSDTASVCPHCGYKLRRSILPVLGCLALGVVPFVMIALIAAIAIPNLLRSRMLSNESSAIGSLRTIVGAQVAYHAANDRYATEFSDLTDSDPPFLFGNWNDAESGYTFVLGGDANNFTANANVVDYFEMDSKGFFTDSSGIIRYALEEDADASSPPIGE